MLGLSLVNRVYKLSINLQGDMSGHSYSTWCPRCKSENSIMASQDHKPHDCVSGECLECGFCYYTSCDNKMTLDEVNELRADHELEPLKELRPQTNKC